MINKVLFARVLLIIYSFEMIFSNPLLALGGGPSQPEMENFKQIDATNLVDPFTGDFSYNIPLFEIGGYPLNLAYSGPGGVEEEASWVGLGWTLNPGVINHDVRGVSDDFNKETIKRTVNIRRNWTVGLSASMKKKEVYGYNNPKISALDNLTPSLTVNYNNYNGFGIESGINLSVGLSKSQNSALSFGGNLGISSGPNGANISASLALNAEKGKYDGSLSIDGGFNSREGMSSIRVRNSITTNSRLSKKQSERLGNIIQAEINSSRKERMQKRAKNDDISKFRSMSSTSFNYTPNIPLSDYPLNSKSYSGNVKFGVENNGITKFVSIQAHYSEQKLSSNEIIDNAVGMLYLQNADENSVFDYAKEKNIPFNRYSSTVPLPYLTPDIYNVMVQGAGGQFKSKRSDNGVLHVKKTQTESNGTSVGVELGGGDLFRGGVDVNVTSTEAKNGQWADDNNISYYYGFKSNDESRPRFQPAFISNAQELSSQPIPQSVDELSMISNIVPVHSMEGLRMIIDDNYVNASAASQLSAFNGQTSEPNSFELNERKGDQTVMSYLTAKEAAKRGFQKDIYSYSAPQSLGQMGTVTSISRTSRNDNHLSEITVNNPGGARYIFGIPAYNNLKNEATFNVDASSNLDASIVSIFNEDASTNNSKGRDHFYEKTETPAYAHSYLLTAILSPDYIDITNNGISSDDAGSIVKFNYTRVYDNFKWRVPYEPYNANYSPGYRAIETDDKASYVFGEKEIWYTHSIESKDEIAFFDISSRSDGLEAKAELLTDEEESIFPRPYKGSRNLKKLDAIRIYSKADYFNNEPGHTPIPIKTIHFEYAESAGSSLFPGITNSSVDYGGKLTLNAVYFTYGTSNKGSINKYQFEYYKNQGNAFHPYNYDFNDRWGNYKHQYVIPNNIFPFTDQDESRQYQNVIAGHLKSIVLPSGSKIEVTLESDDYAFVQDKRAGNMFQIAGFGNNPSSTPEPDLHGHDGLFYPSANNYLFLDLPFPHTDQEFKSKYINNLNGTLYFDCGVRFDNGSDPFDRVKGYAKIEASGIVPGNPTRAFIKLGDINDKNDKYNPIAFSALQTIKLNVQQVAYPNSYIPVEDADFVDIVKGIFGQITSIKELFTNFKRNALRNRKCTLVDLTRSWIRLSDPDMKKLGGGSRVKSIRISDNWSEMSGISDVTAKYGQNYSYTTTDELTGNAISSGVASYEPAIGIEDYLGRTPVPYEEKVKLAPNKFYYGENPYGEQLFPSPSVGYSKVIVTPIGSDEASGDVNTASGSIGYEVHEFYTSKDYPVYVARTTIPAEFKYNKLSKLFNFNYHEYCFVNQGYLVVVNDMHGKPRSNKTYNQKGDLINSVEYFYKNLNNAPCTMLANKVDAINESGAVSQKLMGMETEIYQEMNENFTKASTPGGMLNLDVISIKPLMVPCPIPIPFGLFSTSRCYTRTSALTKFVRKSGVLDRIETTNRGAKSVTRSLLYDQKTNNVIVSSTTNSFHETVYDITIPAYWNYERMGPAYQNLGLVFKNVAIGANASLPSNLTSIVKEGDELVVTDASNDVVSNIKYYVVQEGNDMIVMNGSAQNLSPGNYHFKIARSGLRNLFDSPMQTIQTFTNPIVYSNGNPVGINLDNIDRVINAKAVEYNDYSVADCQTTRNDCSLKENEINTYGFLIRMAVYYMIHYNVTPSHPEIHTTQDLYDYYMDANSLNSPPSGVDLQRLIGFGNISIPIPNSTPYTGSSIEFNSCAINIINNSLSTNLSLDDVFALPISGRTNIGVETEESDNQPQVVEQGSFAVRFDILSDTRLMGIAIIECACPFDCIVSGMSERINPYALGFKGNWKPFRSYTFMEGRATQDPIDVHTKSDGSLSGWEPFWNISSIWAQTSSSAKWKWDAQVTLYDNKGNALEDQDPLFRYSSALFGYKNLYNTAVASNARYQQIANDNFEDYEVIDPTSQSCFLNHWDFNELTPDNSTFQRTSLVAHTGIYSMSVKPSKYIKVERDIDNTPYLNEMQRNSNGQYILNQGNCLKKFSPLPGDYIASAWIKIGDGCNPLMTPNCALEVKLNGSSGIQTVTIHPSGPIVEGWQRVEGKFTVLSGHENISVKLINNESTIAYFDDIRIHPFSSNMKTFVYNPFNLKLMSTLDENNYATFFEYDQEGKLVRIKKETEKGIVTLKEGRQELLKNIP